MGNSRSSSTHLHDTKEHIEPQILHSYQKIIMRKVWRHMAQSGQGSCASTILKRLIIKEPSIKNVFHHTAVLTRMRPTSSRSSNPSKSIDNIIYQKACGLTQHQSEIIRFIQFVMTNLDSPSMISMECVQIGRIHRRFKEYGLKTDYWDLLGESLTETIREYQGWRRHRESLRAANLLVSFIVDRIRSGFLQRQSFTCTDGPRPILKPSLSKEKDLNGNVSRKSSIRRKESVRFNSRNEDNDDNEDKDERRRREGIRDGRRNGSNMIRSKSQVVNRRREWIDTMEMRNSHSPIYHDIRENRDNNEDDDDDDDDDRIEYRRKSGSCPHLSNLQRRQRSSSERRKNTNTNNDSSIGYESPSSYCISRRLPRTPTIDFTRYSNECKPISSSSSIHHNHSILSRYHSLDNGYHSCSSPSDGEHSLHKQSHSIISNTNNPSTPSIPISRPLHLPISISTYNHYQSTPSNSNPNSHFPQRKPSYMNHS